MADDAGLPTTPRFAVVLRGYKRRQVDEHVERLQRVFARMRADLDAARSQSPTPAGPVARAAPRPRPGGPEGDQIGSFTDRMQSILAEAEAEAAEIRRNAHQAARAETEGVRAQLADLIRQRDAVLAELTRMRGQLEGMLAAPTASMPARSGPGYRPGPPLPPPGPDPARRYGPAPLGPAVPVAGGPLGDRGPGAPPGPVPSVPTHPGAGPSGAVPRAPEAATRSADPPRTGSTAAPAVAHGSVPAAPGRAPRSGADRAGAGPGASGPGAPNGSGPRPDAADRVSGRDAPGGAPSSGSGSTGAGGEATPRRDPGKPAHRLPSGAYPAVTSGTPGGSASGSSPEPTELFRAPALAEARNTPQSQAGEPRTTAGSGRQPERPGARGGVQSADQTVLAEVPGRPAPRTDRA